MEPQSARVEPPHVCRRACLSPAQRADHYRRDDIRAWPCFPPFLSGHVELERGFRCGRICDCLSTSSLSCGCFFVRQVTTPALPSPFVSPCFECQRLVETHTIRTPGLSRARSRVSPVTRRQVVQRRIMPPHRVRLCPRTGVSSRPRPPPLQASGSEQLARRQATYTGDSRALVGGSEAERTS